MTAPDRLAALAARAMCPERPRLSEALEVAAAVWREGGREYPQPSDVLACAHDAPERAATLAPEVWESLAARGVIPSEWVAGARRGFRARDGAVLPHPPTLGACVALASDPAGLATVEQLAGEVARRLRPWCHEDDPVAVVWSVRARPYDASSELPQLPLASLGAALLDRALLSPDAQGAWRAVLAAHRRVHRWNGEPPATAWIVAGYERDRVAWATAAARGVAAFARLPNPFEPLVEIWGSGYALDALSDGVLTLVAPALV